MAGISSVAGTGLPLRSSCQADHSVADKCRIWRRRSSSGMAVSLQTALKMANWSRATLSGSRRMAAKVELLCIAISMHAMCVSRTVKFGSCYGECWASVHVFVPGRRSTSQPLKLIQIQREHVLSETGKDHMANSGMLFQRGGGGLHRDAGGGLRRIAVHPATDCREGNAPHPVRSGKLQAFAVTTRARCGSRRASVAQPYGLRAGRVSDNLW